MIACALLAAQRACSGVARGGVAAAKDTATTAARRVALAIIAGGGAPAFRHAGSDLLAARRDADGIDKAMAALRKIAPDAGAYVSESNYFRRDWQRAFWGTNYPRLLAAKRRYDPHGLFFVHHGVGSEGWSGDGFTPVS
ncbi:BBE domain-containing protein [Rhodanobacter lindaniclasticus]